MKVTTRKDQVDFPKKTQNNASQPNVYVVIVNDEVREMSTRKCKKKIIARILDLGHFFQRHEKYASI